MTDTGWLVLIFLVLLVVILNLGLLSALRRKDREGQPQMLQRALKTLRRPWQDEEDQLEKLSGAVAKYRSNLPEHNEADKGQT